MSLLTMLEGLVAAEIRFVVIGGVAASTHGSAFVTDDLDICYDAAVDNVGPLAAVLRAWNSYPRGIEPGLPFIMDEKQFRVTPVMTLRTMLGDLDVMHEVAGIGDYDATLAASVSARYDAFSFRILSLPALIQAKKAAGRPKDRAQLPELEALLAIRTAGGSA